MRRPKEPDYIKTRLYILHLLRGNLEKHLPFHNHIHTKDVMDSVVRLASMEGFPDEQLLLLKTAALYHDTGFLFQYDDNPGIAVNFAEETLPGFGYNHKQIKIISNAMQSVHSTPNTELEYILCDANIDYFGRIDFIDKIKKLREELTKDIPFLDKKGVQIPFIKWYKDMFEVLENHKYFTESALRLRQKGKEENMSMLQQILAEKGILLE